MRIAQVTQHYLPVIGGQEIYIENLNKVFRNRGWNTTIFQPSRGVNHPEVVNVRRIPKIGGLVPGSEPYVFNFFLKLNHLRQLADADVIISHYAFHATPLKKVSRKTIILSHGVEWHFDNMNWDDRIHERRAKECLDRFVHVVNDTHYLRHLGLPVPPASGFFTEVLPGKWFIPNCVDTSKFSRTAGLPELLSRPAILVPRQVCEDRGIHLAIEAFRHVADVHPELHLHILGKVRPGAYIERCRTLVRKLSLESKVVFQDHVGNGTMADYYSSSVLTLIPTLRREGTSLSALESMSCSTATITTNVAGLRDLPSVQCDPDAEAVARAVIETYPQRNKIGNAQSMEVMRTFNMDNWSDAWCRVIEAVYAKQ